MISTKQMSYALAVGQTLHFRKAAELCAISQSALSTAINQLEKQLGMQIFERDNKKVLVTAFGKIFLHKAGQIKIELDDLSHLALQQKLPLSYPMSMGVIPTIGPYLLPKVLPLIRDQYPDFKLRILEEQSHVLVEQVTNGEIDVAILALPFAVESLLTFEFWQEDFYWVAHRSDVHTQKKEMTHADLMSSHLMLLKDGHCLKDHALAACQLRSSELDNSYAATSLHTLIQMVAGRMGTTLVPKMALDQLLAASSELKALHLNEPGPHRRLAFICRPNYSGVKSIELMMELFTQELRKHN